MALLTEPNRISDVILMEEAETFDYSRDQITVLNGTAASVVGQVLGQITLGTATSAVKASGANTGAGTLVVDATAPVQLNAMAGIYTVRVPVVGTFIVTDPKGVVLGDAIYGAGATVTFSDRIKFAFHDDASTHFAAGDGFDVTVAAGSGKYTQLTVAALDGSQNAAAILITPLAALTADAVAAAVVRGPVLVKQNGLVWTAAMSAPQIAAGIVQLQALGFVMRTDLGV